MINISTYEPQFTCACDEVFKFAIYQHLFLTDVLVIAVVARLAVCQVLCSELHLNYVFWFSEDMSTYYSEKFKETE